jgi:hypothetical protein
MKYNFIIVLILYSVLSCRNSKTENKGRLLAKVGSESLYEKDLNIAFAKNDDSVKIKKAMVNEWVKNQLTYSKAMSSLSAAEKDKNKELRSYYESLIRYLYLDKMVSEHMDTTISGKDIEEYYAGNQKNFELKRNIIRFLYVKVPVEMRVNQRVIDWMQYPDKRTMDSLRVFVKKYARNSLLDTAKWYYFSDITKEIPILQDYNPEHFIKSNAYVELKDAQYLYMMNIVDGRIKEEVAPLSMVKEKIRTIILNRRKINKEKELENSIYHDAETQHQFEIY